METLAQILKRLRESKNKTQVEVGKELGWGQGRISALERGDGDPQLSTIQRLAAYYGVSPATLVSDEVPEMPEIKIRKDIHEMRLELIKHVLAASETEIEVLIEELRASIALSRKASNKGSSAKRG